MPLSQGIDELKKLTDEEKMKVVQAIVSELAHKDRVPSAEYPEWTCATLPPLQTPTSSAHSEHCSVSIP